MVTPIDGQLPWSWPRRLLFRWVFLYCMLQTWPAFIGAVPGGGSLVTHYTEWQLFAARWSATHVLHLEIDDQHFGEQTGGSDGTASHVECLNQGVATLLMALAWSIIDRRKFHPVLAEFLRVSLRCYLCMQMLSYGLAKIIPPRQMAPPSPAAF